MPSKKMPEKANKVILHDYDPSLTLRDPEMIFATFMDCLLEGDDVAASEALAAGLRYANKSSLSRLLGIPRRTLYNFLGKRNSPSLELIAKICRAIRLEAAKKRTERPSIGKSENGRLTSLHSATRDIFSSVDRNNGGRSRTRRPARAPRRGRLAVL